MRRIFLAFVFFALLLAACNLPRPGSPDPATDLMRTIVAATLQALTPQATPTLSATELPPTAASTPTASSGKLSGKVCYHDSGVLQLTLYFQNTATQQLLTQSVSRPDETYSIELPAGTYKVFGWPPDYTVGVLVKGKTTVDVSPAQTLSGVDLCDYSQGPFAVPYPPGFSPSTERGSVSGGIYGYPGSDRLTVVAFNKGTGYWYYVILLPGEYTFTVSELPAGRYQLVAYDNAGITGGTQPTVYVIAGQNTSADINDWGAGYPANPVH